RAGKDRLTAILESGHKRARPIVMTTVAMIAGMLPVALGLGGDKAFREPMAIAVIGGLITSTALTLVIVPAAFTLIDDIERWLALRVFPYRERLVRGNLTRAFPHFDEPELRAVMRGYYLGFAQMLVEIIKGASLPGEEIRRRVRIVNLEGPRAHLQQGQSVLL